MSLDPREVIADFLQSHDLDFEATDANTFMVTLPGEKIDDNGRPEEAHRSYIYS